MLQAGQPAPGFELPDADMQAVSLEGFRNRSNVVLYFYPKDDTPSCTMQAIDFSDMLDEFTALETVVLGISMDDCLSHGSFRDKHGLAMPLLADVDGEVCRSTACARKDTTATKIGIQRSTFIIDKHGMLRHARGSVTGHAVKCWADMNEKCK